MNELISEHPFLQKIFDQQVEGRIRQLSAEELLVKQEEKNDFIYILVTGSLRVEHLLANGLTLMIDTVYPYDFMGDLEYLINELPVHQVRVLEESTVVELTLKEYQRLMTNHGPFALAISQSLGHKLKGTTDNFLNYVSLPLRIRLYHLLLSLLSHEEIPSIFYNSELLAETLGVTPRSVNRLIKELKDQQFVSLKKNELFFSDEGIQHMTTVVQGY